MLKNIVMISTLVAILMLTGCAKRNPAWQDDEVLSLQKQFPIVGNPLDISFDDRYIYIAQDQGGISIIDTNDDSIRWLTGMVSHDGSQINFSLISRIAIVGEHNRLFVNETTGADEIKIIDVSEQDSLNVIDAITGGTYDIQDMHFSAIPNPTGPEIIETVFCTRDQINYGRYNGNLWLGTEFSFTPVGYASGVTMNDQYIFVASQQRGLVIYDMTTHVKISETVVPGEALKVVVQGSYAYIAGKQGGLSVVNFADASAPIVMSTFDTTGYATTIDVKGNWAAVNSGSGGVYLFDISSPGNPVLKQRLDSVGYTNNAKLMGDRLLVATRDEGVLIYEID